MTADPYRFAYETALAEITEITAKFEQLRTRKSQVENLIAVLQPIFEGEAGGSAAVATQQAMPEEQSVSPIVNSSEAEEQTNYSYLDVPNPLPEGDGDPFERRVKTTFRFKGLAAQRSY